MTTDSPLKEPDRQLKKKLSAVLHFYCGGSPFVVTQGEHVADPRYRRLNQETGTDLEAHHLVSFRIVARTV